MIWNTMVERCRNPNTDSIAIMEAGHPRCAEMDRTRRVRPLLGLCDATYQPGLLTGSIQMDITNPAISVGYRFLTNANVAAQWIETPKGRMCLKHAATALGINRSTFRERLRRGVPMERLFDPPDITRRCLRDRAG
jgi:hypothetical protein